MFHKAQLELAHITSSTQRQFQIPSTAAEIIDQCNSFCTKVLFISQKLIRSSILRNML